MISSPLVSIIVPVYNGEKYLAQTLDNALAQTYPHIEIVVVNDGSTDASSQIAQNFQNKFSKIRYLEQQNKGLAGARNTGLRHASGEFIQFLDADDLLEPEKIEKQLAYLLAHPDIFAVYGDTRFFRGATGATIRFHFPVHSGEIAKQLVNGNFMPVNSLLIRRADDYFDERLRVLEDWDYWLRLSFQGKRFEHLPEILSAVRIHDNNMSNNAVAIAVGRLVILDKIALTGQYGSHVAYQKFETLYFLQRPGAWQNLQQAARLDKRNWLRAMWYLAKFYIKKIIRLRRRLYG